MERGKEGSVMGMMLEAIEQVEESLIGAALLEPARVMPLCENRRVTAEWWTLKEAQAVWPIILKQWREKGMVDPVLMAAELKRPDVLGWCRRCLDVMPSAAHAGRYVEQLAGARLQRMVGALGRQLIADAADLGGQEALDRAEAAIVALRDAERASYGGFKTAKDFEEQIVSDYQQVYQKRIVERDAKFFIGKRLPWDVLNVLYTGVKAGIHIVAARPSQGKTAVAVCMSAGMAFSGIKQLFFSVDMHPRLLVERYGSLLGQVSLPKLNFGGSHEDVQKMARGLKMIQMAGGTKELPPNNILISDAYRVDRIVGEIHRAVKYDGVECVWIDYLQILSGDKDYKTHKDEIDAVLAKLKQCALALNIPIFCLAQLNRENGKDPNRKPLLTDLGDSGSIEREASTVLMLWKDADVRKYWDENPPLHLAMGQESLAKKLEPMWLLLLKNQQGATGERPFVFYKNYFMFRPAEHAATPNVERDKNNRVIKIDRSPYFDVIRDDFLVIESKDGKGLDDALRRDGALGFRGLENLNKREVER